MGQWLDNLHPILGSPSREHSQLSPGQAGNDQQAKQHTRTGRIIATPGCALPASSFHTRTHACMQFLDGWQQVARLLQMPLRSLRMTSDTAWGCQSTLNWVTTMCQGLYWCHSSKDGSESVLFLPPKVDLVGDAIQIQKSWYQEI